LVIHMMASIECFVVLLLQNLVIIHSLEGRPEAATHLARSLVWVYVSSCLPISILLSVFLSKFM
jgi:hypothetical protein